MATSYLHMVVTYSVKKRERENGNYLQFINLLNMLTSAYKESTKERGGDVFVGLTRGQQKSQQNYGITRQMELPPSPVIFTVFISKCTENNKGFEKVYKEN